MYSCPCSNFIVTISSYYKHLICYTYMLAKYYLYTIYMLATCDTLPSLHPPHRGRVKVISNHLHVNYIRDKASKIQRIQDHDHEGCGEGGLQGYILYTYGWNQFETLRLYKSKPGFNLIFKNLELHHGVKGFSSPFFPFPGIVPVHNK